MIRVSHFLNCFVIIVGRQVCSNLQKSLILIIFYTFGQVKGWLIIELHKIIRVSHVVTYAFFISEVGRKDCSKL